MKCFKFLLFICWVIIFNNQILAQNNVHLFKVKIAPFQNTIYIADSNLVDTSSSYYCLLNHNNFFKIKSTQLGQNLILNQQFDDTIVLYYKIFNKSFTNWYYHKSTKLISTAIYSNPFESNDNSTRQQSWNNLNTSGLISRGLSLGNNQDLVVNSNLNLKLSGKIANDVTITGVLSEDNTPIQPEGNTAQIQDFDKVFIQLEKDSNTLVIGDFLMQKPQNSYFLKYQKKSRGLHFNTINRRQNSLFKTSSDIAVSRGKFARNTINGQEGIQGPYRLTGGNGEIFIILIASTEAVYVDGIKMKRGESNDYVINYNTGEINFMPSIIITRFSRIIVEFQYADRNYQRSLANTGFEFSKLNTTIYGNMFMEWDNKNQPFLQDIEGYDSIRNMSAKQILINSGDDMSKNFIYQSKAANQFNPEKQYYIRKDSLGFSGIYMYQDKPLSENQNYEVYFSYLGAGKGNYIQKISNANGKVYEWIAPVNGVMQGQYEPIQILIPPTFYQMANIGLIKKFKNGSYFIESVYTKNNINTYSKLDKSNDDGWGFFAGSNHQIKLKSLKDSNWIYTDMLKLEIVSSKFKFLERYRDVEFDRIWNRQIGNAIALPISKPEFVFNSNFTISNHKKLSTSISNGFLNRNGQIGNYNILSNEIKHKNNRLGLSLENMNHSIVQNDSQNLKNNFKGLQMHYQLNLKKGILMFKHQYQNNNAFYTKDSLILNSFKFNMTQVSLSSVDSSKFQYKIEAENRDDQLPMLGNFVKSSNAKQIGITNNLALKNGSKLQYNATYRTLQILDTNLIKGQNEHNVLGRIEWDLYLLKKSIRWSSFYQLASGLEQRRDFVYNKVGDGLGAFMWNDYNQDGVQTLNEFEIASEYDKGRANYIRTFLPLQGFIKVRATQINQSVFVSAPQNWKNKTFFKKTLSRFNYNIIFKNDFKTQSTQFMDYALPVNPLGDHQNLLSANTNIRNTLFFNRNSAIFGLDITHLALSNKILLINGFENKTSNEIRLNTRLSINKILVLFLELKQGEKAYNSQFLNTRNYEYQFHELIPKLNYVNTNGSFGITLFGSVFDAKSNLDTDSTKTKNIETGLDIRWSETKKGTLSAEIKYVNIAYIGNISSPLGYELLKGLQNGNNYTWQFVFQRRLGKNIQADISYEGRKSIETPAIHIGRLMIRYIF